MSKSKPIAAKTQRTSRDAVTGEMQTTVLDAVQRALERIVAFIDRERLKLSNDDAARLAALLEAELKKMQPHQG